ncbi:hypothetical protein TorRG33x02_117080 [Trema orientale]|uniref:RNase H type-1 domain-containing protein n=1 Tax=Trema orientale TaxID=63057 RepID=A0A2P5F3L8_TREOI|nr:hypothetical protein TorRG33x02_117080 [Trema orientale]
MDLPRPYSKVNQNIKWKPPEIDKLKLNIYVAVTIGCSFIGVSGVVRNSKGWVVAAVTHRTISFYDPFIVECIALLECLQFCFESNVHPDLIETDSTRVIDAIRERSTSFVEAHIISDVLHLLVLLGNVGASFIACQGNMATHNLASYDFNVCTNDTIPACISEVVMEDLSSLV